MPRPDWCCWKCRHLMVAVLVVVSGCEPKSEPAVRMSNARRAEDVAAARLAENADGDVPVPPPDVPVQPMRPTDTQPAPTPAEMDEQVRDPAEEVIEVEADLADAPAEIERIKAELAQPDIEPVRRQMLAEKLSNLLQDREAYPRLIERLRTIERANKVRLSLPEAIHRTLLNSHRIQVAAYTPAIESARVVEAEAQFDAVFFSDFTNDKQNRPSSSQLSGTDTQTRLWQAGVRKLLSSGMVVQTGYNVTRNETDLVFQTLNPSYFNQFFVEFRQPLLQGFGLDYNRSQIMLRKLDRRVGEEQVRREIRETVFNVEQAYWRLFQARRSITVTARLLSELETILYSLRQRLALRFDVSEVQVSLTESRYEQQVAEFVRLRNQVFEAEDTLKALINDPALNLAVDLEIIPASVPVTEPLVLDRIGEVTAALNYRSELREARLQIEQAQIAIGVAKNQALPQLDLTFRYVVDGLGGDWDRAISQLSENDFHEYLIQLQFEWPIGARAGEAQIRQARLQQAQAIAAHRGQIENVILETQNAIRDIFTAYDQIGPSMRSALASAAQLYATQARMERRDLPNLQVELDAHQALASARQQLLQAVTDYNIAIINLERSKGTLLEYNNIVLNSVENESYLEPYKPIGP